MTRSERRLFRDTVIIGACLTIIVIALDIQDQVFLATERFFYDFRARHFQRHTAKPTDQLVHLNIDDAALGVIGKFPWPREKLAEIVDEIRMAEAKAIAFDVIFAEKSETGHREVDPRELPLLPPSPKTPDGRDLFYTVRIDHDDAFAQALRRFGNVVIPVALNLSLIRPESKVYDSLVELLKDDPTLIDGDDIDSIKQRVLALLRERGHDERDLIKRVDDHLIEAAKEGMFRRIEAEFKDGLLERDDLRERILPRIDPTIGGSPTLRRMDDELARVLALRSLRRFARPAPKDLPLLEAYQENATLRELSDAAALTGFVDFVPMADGVVRYVPLWSQHRGWAFPQIGLSLACAMLGVDIRKVEVTPQAIILPCPDGRRIEVPIRYHDTPRGTYAAFFDVPWFGKSGLNEWETMYDYPEHKQKKQQASLSSVWAACEYRERMRHNNLNANNALTLLASRLKSPPLSSKIAATPPADTSLPDAYAPHAELVKKEMTEQAWLPYLEEITPDEYAKLPELDPTGALDKNTVESYRALKNVLQNNAALQAGLVRQRAKLRRDLGGKACLIGYTAVGAIADIVPTSLHPRCPGVVVHGIIFNSIMTGDFWRKRDPWVGIAFTVIIGVMTTTVIATLPAWKALVATALISVGYLLFNGMYLFDLNNQIVGVSGPVFAGLAVWAGGTLSRYILESAERRRVTARFSSYADKALVDYVLNNPQEKLDGKVQELSVVFTDLQGFTTISEALGPATVPLLNEYMGLMVPIIRNQNGYINKFLGDGIMYFFGAPLPNARHAHNAILSVLEMQEAMIPFNDSLTQRDLPNLILRAGITTGEMVVGDAGPPERSDYTVIGDNVNLSARLEGANKAVGTRILLNERCRELIGDAFLCRPIAKLQVKGKTQGVMTYEAMATTEKATHEQRELARISAEVVHPFCEREFEDCLKVIALMEATHGLSKFTYLYREECTKFLKEPPPPGWSGEIELKEK